MLELKFAIYYRAASLPPQASYAALAETPVMVSALALHPHTYMHMYQCHLSPPNRHLPSLTPFHQILEEICQKNAGGQTLCTHPAQEGALCSSTW